MVELKNLQNGQSYADLVEQHIINNYISGLTLEDVTNIDTVCGATYGCNTVKELVTIAFNDYKSSK